MLSGRVIFACSLAASATIHAVLWWKLPRRYGYAIAPSPTPTAPVARMMILPPVEKPPEPPKTIFGDAVGGGTAINASAGDTPQAGPKTEIDQADQSRDPAGERAAAPKPLAQAVTAPPPAALPTPPPSPLLGFRKPEKPAPPVEQPTTPQRPPQEPPQTPPKPDAVAAPPTPAAGTPRPQTDRDSDPFAKTFAPEFRRGRVMATKGRQFKFSSPKISQRSFADLRDVVFADKLVLSITLEPTGRPRLVVVKQSIGSRSIDRAFLMAAYESWFEPLKDDAGASISDEFEFPIELR